MEKKRDEKNIFSLIQNRAVGIMPTDTVYGLVASALDEKAVSKIYKIKKRDENKPFIILISSFKDLELFDIRLERKILNIIKKIWPNKVSVILPCKKKKFFYLHRGKGSLAFRMPKQKKLLNILNKTGPLASTSANLSGQLPAKNIKEAEKYFGRKVDFYIDGGELNNTPSTIISIKRNRFLIIRDGSVNIDKFFKTSIEK
ncbi:MAG TPA: L-threonylcarbamoyladenylate synthase [Candidatus Pacearchaeota archaeon]|nr:L-threonylcarbamoyladenylate synthase [Candidatus Pacearchaeota archaeon]